MLWNFCPKEKFMDVTRLYLATSLTAVIFNDGHMGMIKVFEKLGLGVGNLHVAYAKVTLAC